MFEYNDKSYNISAVIISYNDSKRIVDLCTNLLTFSIFDSLVISDNNSKDKEKDILSQFESKNKEFIKVLFNNSNLGYAKGNNVGLKYLIDKNIDFVFSINSDIGVEKNVVENMIKLLINNQDCSISSCRMIEYGKEKPAFYEFPKISSSISDNLGFTHLFKIHAKPNKIENNIAYVDFLRSSFCCMKYNDLKNINFYDSNIFLYGGEATIGLKLKMLNKKEIISLSDFYMHNHIYSKSYKMTGYKDTYKSFSYIFKNYLNVGCLKLFFYKCSYHLGIMIRKILRIK